MKLVFVILMSLMSTLSFASSRDAELFGDYNGDGIQDFYLFYYDDYAGVYQLWAFVDEPYIQDLHLANFAPEVPWEYARLGDFNGDGASDFVVFDPRVGSGHFWVTIAKPGNRRRPASTPRLWGVSGSNGFSKVKVRDINRDGKDDLVVRLNGQDWVYISNGRKFSVPQLLQNVRR